MNRTIFALYIFCIFLIEPTQSNSQCTPPSADNCEDANVLCSLDELNGYTCSNPNYSNPTGCSPLCPSGGGAHNTTWWAFVTEGGLVTITITYQNCSVNGTGVQMGIWGDCDCAESVACNPNCTGPGQFTITATLTACKNYYFFVDGCSGDVCDFTITTSGGAMPNLKKLTKINDDPDRRIQVCRGVCDKNFKVAGQEGNCEPTYEWTLDGNIVGWDDDNIDLSFPDEGDFQLCVTAYIGNPNSGSICDQEGPECVTIEVRPIRDKLGIQRILCAEQIPHKWHSQEITGPGEYRNTFKGTDCCIFDSVVTFNILPIPIPPNVFHIGCDKTDMYTDPTTRQSFSNCHLNEIIFLSKSSIPYRCDSTYKLTAIFLDFNITFTEECVNGKIEINPRIVNRTKTCGGGEIYEFAYKWYLQKDFTKNSIETKEKIIVDKRDIYCVEMKVNAKLGNVIKTCYFDFCEGINEDFTPNFFLSGDTSAFRNMISTYVDTVKQNSALKKYHWTVTGGTILTTNPNDSSEIRITWDSTETFGIICLTIDSICNSVVPQCISVSLKTTDVHDANSNNTIRIIPNPNQGIFTLDGLLPYAKSAIEIISLDGKSHYKKNGMNYSSKLNVDLQKEHIPNGTYFIKVNQKNRIQTLKMILTGKE
ncbi:MAG: T9SS type A sorting domain-containing protein [Saprospiraceae bacterium]|uniref:T9SS type A sorting domain-containing protein n=1 Tax=Candidatus Defluviibacterium haderslevense TaxID=2981993 RepID=A0A9D7XCY3_9BACT|nr:T9SS type A sorting domain-containing protein [Candidatus Defluviibacterium haderslevense]